jgi:hypothetical protein
MKFSFCVADAVMLLTCSVPFQVCLYCYSQDILWMFLFAVHVGEVYSQILLGLV